MKRTVIQAVTILLATGFLAQVVFAGGIDNKQNFSARYMATGSRNAATDGADIAAYNPAGIMQQKNGFVLEGDIQYIFKDYEHKYTAVNPAGYVEKSQDDPSIIPSFFATYKSDKWGAFTSLSINGGGGTVDYKDGNSITNDVEAGLIGLGGAFGETNNESIYAKSYYLTYTAGGTYKVNDIFSVAAGVRYIDASKEVEAYADLTNGPVLSPDGKLVAEYEDEADGWGWVTSINIKPIDNLLFAIRYESEVELEFETTLKDSTNALGVATLASLGKTNNGKANRNLPAVVGLGVSWDTTEKLNLNSSFTLYLEENADWEGEEDKMNNSYEIGVSATYALMDNLRLSCGYLYTNVGMDADDFDLTAKMSPVLDANSFFLGAGFDFNQHATVELGVATNFYDDATDSSGVEYSKQNTALALAFLYRF